LACKSWRWRLSGVFLFGMWVFLMLHKTAFGGCCVWVSVCVLGPVSMCSSPFLPRVLCWGCWFLVHVNVALHRGFYFATTLAGSRRLLSLCQDPLSPIKSNQRQGPTYLSGTSLWLSSHSPVQALHRCQRRILIHR
jgi:hypothetical protein